MSELVAGQKCDRPGCDEPATGLNHIKPGACDKENRELLCDRHQREDAVAEAVKR